MGTLKIKNPTTRRKAVRSKGGHTLIESGKTATVDVSGWGEIDFDRYEAAGLKFDRKDVKEADDDGGEPTPGAAGNPKTGSTGKGASPIPPKPAS